MLPKVRKLQPDQGHGKVRLRRERGKGAEGLSRATEGDKKKATKMKACNAEYGESHETRGVG